MSRRQTKEEVMRQLEGAAIVPVRKNMSIVEAILAVHHGAALNGAAVMRLRSKKMLSPDMLQSFREQIARENGSCGVLFDVQVLRRGINLVGVRTKGA